MVVHTSDSCSTLISLGLNNGKRADRYDFQQQGCYEHAYQQTDLQLPEDGHEDLAVDNNDETLAGTVHTPLYLPLNTEVEPVDVFLRSVPSIVERADELLASPARILDATHPTNDRIVYVGQGELGHATPSQCEILVSDKATTCHIVAVRSVSAETEPLVSLTHLDAAGYGDCLRKLVREHRMHHQDANFDNFQEEKKEDGTSCVSSANQAKIRMELHVMGGFEDDTSRGISNFLVNLLAQIALEERDSIRMVLQTCVVSSLNDTGHSAPIGRGLGIETRTGKVFLAKVAANCVGPVPELRSVRLWSSGNVKQLSIIHTSRSNHILIEPFEFAAFKEIDMLLTLPDTIMLEYISTSPLVEEDDFCDKIRSSLLFLKRHTSREIFPRSHPLLYRRDGASAWKQVL